MLRSFLNWATGAKAEESADSDSSESDQHKKKKQKEQQKEKGGGGRKKKSTATKTKHGNRDAQRKQQKGKKALKKSKIAKNADDNNDDSDVEEAEEEDVTLIPIIPRLFAQNLDKVLVQKVEQFPARSEQRIKAIEIVNQKEQMMLDGQKFNAEMITDLAYWLTILVEGGQKIGNEKLVMEEDLRDSGAKANADGGTAAAQSLASADDGANQQVQVVEEDSQITTAKQNLTKEDLMPSDSTYSLRELEKVRAENALISCSSATLEFVKPEKMLNLIDSSTSGPAGMMLQPNFGFQFGQMNLVGYGEPAKTDMNMSGIENGIANALEKGLSASGAKACEIGGNMWEQQNVTARVNIFEGHKTLRHNDDNNLMQNLHIVDGKIGMAMKGIDANKELAIKHIDYIAMLNKDILENNFKYNESRLEKVHTENMAKIKSGEEMMKNRHEKEMDEQKKRFELCRKNLDQLHDQKLVTLTNDSHLIKVVQQGEKQRWFF